VASALLFGGVCRCGLCLGGAGGHQGLPVDVVRFGDVHSLLCCPWVREVTYFRVFGGQCPDVGVDFYSYIFVTTLAWVFQALRDSAALPRSVLNRAFFVLVGRIEGWP